MGLTFFGLSLSYRENLFSKIHEIVFWGNGGYSFNEVYNFPIWLREFIFNKLKTHYEKDKKSTDQQLSELKNKTPQPKFKPQNFKYK